MTTRISEAVVGGNLDFSMWDCLQAGKGIEPDVCEKGRTLHRVTPSKP